MRKKEQIHKQTSHTYTYTLRYIHTYIYAPKYAAAIHEIKRGKNKAKNKSKEGACVRGEHGTFAWSSVTATVTAQYHPPKVFASSLPW
jgi:hypothetical protein